MTPLIGFRPWLRYQGITLATLCLSACAVGPDYVRPAAPAIGSYTQTPLPERTASTDVAAGSAQTFQAADVPANWWTLFSSDAINRLVQEAIGKNPDLEAAQAALRQAQETASAGEGVFLPTLDLTASPTREKISGASFGQPGAPGSIFTLYNASVNVSYALDVFGGNRREVESLEAQADFQRFQMEGTYLSLTANVITAAVQEASLREQISETEHIVSIERQQLGALNDQLKLGNLTRLSVLSQEATMIQTEATLPVLRKQLAQKHAQLTVLTGHYPNEKRADIFSLAALHLPEHIPVTLPSKLVEQRPDIRAAEAQLHTASANVGVATANMLPQITLNGGYGTSATHFHDMFSPEAEIWNLGAGLTQPLFHGGQLLHQRRAAMAGYERALAQYRSTVLLAFENVSDALYALQFDAEALKAQADAERVAAQGLEAAQIQFRGGSITYLSLLDAERTSLQTRLATIQARANRLADTAALFQALGGGWWNRSALPN